MRAVILRTWAIAIVFILLLIGCDGLDSSDRLPPASPIATPEASPSPTPTLTLSPPATVPPVERERLAKHLQALNFERYSSQNRDRARAYLAQTLTESGWNVKTQPFTNGANLTAQRQTPSSSAKTLLLVAHYDTVRNSPGADDNASAVVAILEIARLLATRPTTHNLAIALFDQEEAGLLGSLAYTTQPANLANLMGVINLEMLGYTCNMPGCQTFPEGLPVTPPSDRGDFLGIVGDAEHPDLLRAFQVASDATLPEIVTVPIPFKGLLTPDVLRSDHASFWARNIGAVMVSDTANFRNPNYHQPSDTPDTLDLDFLTGATQLVLKAVLSLLESS
ncbi:MAG: M28 family peptidase [Oscillatoriales cyanobacterium C42_A2020_001]|nr:M28 family peptidase [Leptolyngbyaceae cyanobacterium C42_A2020_001]